LMSQAICRATTTSGHLLKLHTETSLSSEVTIAANPGSVTSYADDGGNSWREIWTNSFDSGVAWTPGELAGFQVGVIEENAKVDGCTQICYKLLMSRTGAVSSPSASPSGSPSPSPSVSPSESPSFSPSASPSGSPSVSPSESPSGSPSASPSPPIADKLARMITEELAFNRAGIIAWGMNFRDFLRDRWLAPGETDNYDVDLTLTYNAGNITQIKILGGDGNGESGLELKVIVYGLAI